MNISADMPWQDGFVGAFESLTVMRRFMEAFPEAIVCVGDSFEGYAEGILKAAESVAGKSSRYPSVAVANLVLKVTQFSPRYEFRIRFGGNGVARGRIDRWSVHLSYNLDDGFPESLRQRFLAFLSSLDLGRPRIHEYPGSRAEKEKLERRGSP